MNEWIDTPIKTKTEDEFNRTEYAKQVAHLITDSHSWEDSVVFGLSGPWGSGKTSMLGLIAEEITERWPGWRIGRFTPWASSDMTGLLEDFYSTLSSLLPTNKSEKFRKAIARLAQITAPAMRSLPLGDSAGTAVEMTAAALLERSSWDEAFLEATEQLEELETPVLLIVDDVDRLTGDELLTLLKVVRLLGRFPGVQYVLAYDENSLLQGLSETNLNLDYSSARRFLEKIVQYPLTVPPLLQEQLMARLSTGIEDIFIKYNRPPLRGERLGDLLNVYLNQLSTPRAIDRYLAQLRHHLPLISSDEVHDEDLLVLLLLKTLFPTLYLELPKWREELLKGHTKEFTVVQSKVEMEPWDTSVLLTRVDKSDRVDARKLLEFLFPQLNKDKFQVRRAGMRRISDRDYFDRYITLSIPSHDVSDSEMMHVLEEVYEGQPGQFRQLLTETTDNKSLLVLTKAISLTSELPGNQLTDPQRLALMEALLPILDEISDTQTLFSSPKRHAKIWIADLISDLSDAISAAQIQEMLRRCRSLTDRIHIGLRLRWPATKPEWAEIVINDLVQQSLEAFVTNLRLQDEAPPHETPMSFVYFIQQYGELSKLSKIVASDLEEKLITVADLAARFVEIHQLLGSPDDSWQLGGFNQELFNSIAPAKPDPFYLRDLGEVEERDLSWPNRKEYAAGRVRQPGS